VRGSLAAGSLFAVGMVVAGPEVIRIWLAPEHLPTRELLAWLGAWLLLYVWQSCFAMLLNGLGSVHLLSRIAVFGAALNVALCVFCGRRWGLTGIAIANVLTLLIGAVQGPVETHLRLREARAPAGFA
jgi:O-antigen/teichoic acid export membrane protein